MAPLEETIGAIVQTAVEEALAPYLRRLADPEAIVYSVPQTAKVLGVSPHIVRRLVDEGRLPLVPHMGGRKVIPRKAVHELVEVPR